MAAIALPLQRRNVYILELTEQAFIMANTPISVNATTDSGQGAWSLGWQAISQGRLWFLLLISAGSASSVIYPHAPLTGLAVVAGASLNRQKAAFSILTIWLVNQLYGFLLRDYPYTLEALSWGAVMGLGSLVIALLVAYRPPFSRCLKGHFLWLVSSFVAGFILYQSMILLAGALMNSLHWMPLPILWGIFSKNGVWALVLIAVHSLLMQNTLRRLAKQSDS